MTARQAILEYLKTHRSFTSADITKITGTTQSCINHAAAALFREGVIVVESKLWRTVYYRLATDDEKSDRVSTNLIFQECRQSEAMKRVLSIYGVRA
ncbi:protein ren [Salmonella enterica]|nr:protein ren [Salmonella enterica]